MQPVDTAQTILEALDPWTRKTAGEVVVHLSSDGSPTGRTWGDLLSEAEVVAAHLVGPAGVRPGELCLLVLPTGIDFLVALLACFRTGVVPVPLPRPSGRAAAPRFVHVRRDSGASVVLGRGEDLALVPAEPGLRRIALEEVRRGPRDLPPPPGPDDAAFVQYSSGSTSAPRGARILHRNLVANLRLLQKFFGTGPETVIASWLPLHHDMGLVANLLQGLALGGRVVLMDPLHFVRRPLAWLEAISRYRATCTGAPNFAYHLLAQIGPGEAKLDLGSWNEAYCGAEPVLPESLERFARAFAPCGFQERALNPCYGLAEATLVITAHRHHRREPASAREVSRAGYRPWRGAAVTRWQRVASCGEIQPESPVAIVDPETGEPCPDGQEGEILVGGPSLCDGYQGSDPLAPPFEVHEGRRRVHTGDLGFVLDGHLYVTGRLKDLLIVAGQNHYPQDLEAAAASAAPESLGLAAAVAIPSAGTEGVLLAIEARTGVRPGAVDLDALAGQVRRYVLEACEVAPERVLILPPRTLPRTTSGKVRRAEVARLAREADLPALAARSWSLAPPPGDLASLLPADPEGRLEPLTSFEAATRALQLSERFGVEVPPEALINSPPVQRILDLIRSAEAG